MSSKFNKPELTQSELESLLEVKVDPDMSCKELLTSVKDNKWIRFVVGKNFNITLSVSLHKTLRGLVGFEMDDSLSPDGAFRFYRSGNIQFVPSAESYSKKNTQETCRAVENKIKEFLVSNGLKYNE